MGFSSYVLLWTTQVPAPDLGAQARPLRAPINPKPSLPFPTSTGSLSTASTYDFSARAPISAQPAT